MAGATTAAMAETVWERCLSAMLNFKLTKGKYEDQSRYNGLKS